MSMITTRDLQGDAPADTGQQVGSTQTNHVRKGAKEHQPTPVPNSENDPTISWLEARIAEAPTDPDEIREAEEDLNEFERNMNQTRREAGARLLYPEVE